MIPFRPRLGVPRYQICRFTTDFAPYDTIWLFPLKYEGLESRKLRCIANVLCQLSQHLSTVLSEMKIVYHFAIQVIRDGKFLLAIYSERAIVFDVETSVRTDPRAVMAVAVSHQAWYSWLSPHFLSEQG